MGKIVKDEIDYSAPSAKRAVNVDYANSQSTLYSTNVQDAIDELSNRVWVGTQAEYNDLETYDDDTDYYITDAENEAFSASNVVFEPSSALNANNVQDAIEIVNSRVANPKASQIRYKETNVGSALNAVEVTLPSKLDKVTKEQTSSSTILDYINNSGSAFGSMGFRDASDSPISGGEITVLWFGSNKRITILCNGYPGTKIYMRHIWNDGYYDEWTTLH